MESPHETPVTGQRSQEVLRCAADLLVILRKTPEDSPLVTFFRTQAENDAPDPQAVYLAQVVVNAEARKSKEDRKKELWRKIWRRRRSGPCC